MDYTDRLRLLALNDPRLAEGLVGSPQADPTELDAKTLALVRLAALVAVGGKTPSYESTPTSRSPRVPPPMRSSRC